MKIINCIIILLTILFVVNYTAFSNKTGSRRYGFISSFHISDSIYHFHIVDLAVLDSAGIPYSCEIGGSFCEISIPFQAIDKFTKKSGLYNESIEADISMAQIIFLGNGFKFSYNP